MPGIIKIVKTDITDRSKQTLYYRIIEHAVSHTLNLFNTNGKAKNGDLMKRKEIRSFLCKFVIEQLHKSGNPNSLVIVGKDFNISLKYKKNTLLRVYLPGDYIMMVYESPQICVPSLKHSHTAWLEPDESYNIKVTPIDLPKSDDSSADHPGFFNEENKNYCEEYNEEVKDMNIESIIEQNLSYELMLYETDLEEKNKTAEFDLCEFPQMISGMVTKVLLENENKKDGNYGWHYIVSSPFKPNSEPNLITSSVSHYYLLTPEQQSNGISNVIYREYLVDFDLPLKSKSTKAPFKFSRQQIHLVMFRVDRGHDSVIGKALESVKSLKVTKLLSIGSMHKFFFILLVLVYFANRFIWGKYDKINESQSSSFNDQDISAIDSREVGYVEAMCKKKNETIVLVAVIFIVMSVLNQIFTKMKVLLKCLLIILLKW